MNKKIFGVKISTLLTVFLCLVCAILLWFYVEFKEAGEDDDKSNSAAVSYSYSVSYDL